MTESTPPPEALTLARIDSPIAKHAAREELGIGSAEFQEILGLARQATESQSRIAALEKEIEGERAARADERETHAAEEKAYAVELAANSRARRAERDARRDAYIRALYDHRATLLTMEDEGVVFKRALKAVESRINAAEMEERNGAPPASDRSPEMKPTDDGERR